MGEEEVKLELPEVEDVKVEKKVKARVEARVEIPNFYEVNTFFYQALENLRKEKSANPASKVMIAEAGALIKKAMQKVEAIQALE